MTIRLLAAAVVLLSSIGATESLLACGEKFLNSAKMTSFERAPFARPHASILVYANPAFNLSKALNKGSVEATLSKAGYRPTTVTSPGAFESAMRSGQWDLVLVDVADSGSVIKRAPASNAPMILPVVYNASKAELKAAKKQHGRILEAPTKDQSLVSAIDEALATKPSASSKPRGTSGR
jgi:hypothetical protein